LFIGKGYRGLYPPGFIFDCMGVLTGIMGLETGFNVFCETGIVTVRVFFRLQDINVKQFHGVPSRSFGIIEAIMPAYAL